MLEWTNELTWNVLGQDVDVKSITTSKIKVHGWWATLFHTQFLLGSYLVPTQFLAPIAASKNRASEQQRWSYRSTRHVVFVRFILWGGRLMWRYYYRLCCYCLHRTSELPVSYSNIFILILPLSEIVCWLLRAPICKRLKVHKHEIFFLTFFAETETIWSQGPVTRDF